MLMRLSKWTCSKSLDILKQEVAFPSENVRESYSFPTFLCNLDPLEYLHLALWHIHLSTYINEHKQKIHRYCRRHTIMFSVILFPQCWSILTDFIILSTRGSHSLVEKHCPRGNISNTVCPEPPQRMHLSEVMLRPCCDQTQHRRSEHLREHRVHLPPTTV